MGPGAVERKQGCYLSGRRLLKKTSPTEEGMLQVVPAGDHFEGALNGMIRTMAAMTATVGGVTACILHPMIRSSQSDFVCALQKTKGSGFCSLQGGVFQAAASRLAVPLRWQKGNACQRADSTSLCPGNFYWSRPLTLFSAVVRCNHWEVNGFSTEDGAERFPPERLTMSPHRIPKD